MKTPEELKQKSVANESTGVYLKKQHHIEKVKLSLEIAVRGAIEDGLITNKGGAFVCPVAEEDLSIAVKYLMQHGWKAVRYYDQGSVYSAFEIEPIALSLELNKFVLGSDDTISVVKSHINYLFGD